LAFRISAQIWISLHHANNGGAGIYRPIKSRELTVCVAGHEDVLPQLGPAHSGRQLRMQFAVVASLLVSFSYRPGTPSKPNLMTKVVEAKHGSFAPACWAYTYPTSLRCAQVSPSM
jgi:hypothetical protein